MKSAEYFIKVLNTDVSDRRAWVLACFSIQEEPADAWRADPYPYRLVQTRTATLYVNPDNTSELLPIEDSPIGGAPFGFKNKITLQPGDLPNVTEVTETTYGNAFFNAYVLCKSFGGIIPYIKGRATPSGVESKVINLLVDDPEPGVEPPPGKITVSQKTVFCTRMLSLDGFSQLCVPGASPRSLTADPRRFELRKALQDKYRDRLDDPVVQAAIDKELFRQDDEWLKGDTSEGFLISSKSRRVVRKKLFLNLGQDASVSGKPEYIETSLSEGWNLGSFPAMVNSLRGGSYARGQETMLGGVIVKVLSRAGANMQVTIDDCGSKLGISTPITEKNVSDFLGFSFVTPGGSEVMTADNQGSYLGTVRLRRSPAYCVLDLGDFCKKCAGPRLSLHPTGLVSAISDIGSTIMNLFMKKMHSAQLEVVDWDYQTQLR